MFSTGIVSATFKNLSTDDVLSITSKANLDAIEWSENHHIELGNLNEARIVLEKTKDSGLSIASYGSYFRLCKGMDFIPHLKTAKALDAPYIRIWAGDKPSAEFNENEYGKAVIEAKKIARIAEDNGIKVALEWHRNTLTDRNQSGLKFLQDVDSPWFRTFWQPSPEMDVTERCKGLDMLSSYIENVHVYYWDSTGRRPLEEGTNEWERYLSLIDSKNHFLLLEFVKDNTIDQFNRDSKTLLKWLGKGV